MKRKSIFAMMMAAIMAFSAVTVMALDYNVPEDATTVTATLALVNPDGPGDEFAMVSYDHDGELIIHITNDTLVYFEDFVPLCDEGCTGMTQMAREVLFGRTLAEVLDGRNLRVIFTLCEDGNMELISVMILFEGIVALENGDNNGYVGFEPLPDYYDYLEFDDGFEPDTLILIGEVVVNNEMLANPPEPFLYDEIVMVPLRVVAEALGYDVSWNNELRSVQLGVGIHLWIGGTEVTVGRMAPIELSTAPVLVNDMTFVPLDFFRNVLNQTAYVFEGQVVVETYSDMA